MHGRPFLHGPQSFNLIYRFKVKQSCIIQVQARPGAELCKLLCLDGVEEALDVVARYEEAAEAGFNKGCMANDTLRTV
jgi:hypothetical protein